MARKATSTTSRLYFLQGYVSRQYEFWARQSAQQRNIHIHARMEFCSPISHPSWVATCCNTRCTQVSEGKYNDKLTSFWIGWESGSKSSLFKRTMAFTVILVPSLVRQPHSSSVAASFSPHDVQRFLDRHRADANDSEWLRMIFKDVQRRNGSEWLSNIWWSSSPFFRIFKDLQRCSWKLVLGSLQRPKWKANQQPQTQSTRCQWGEPCSLDCQGNVQGEFW